MVDSGQRVETSLSSFGFAVSMALFLTHVGFVNRHDTVEVQVFYNYTSTAFYTLFTCCWATAVSSKCLSTLLIATKGCSKELRG